ncbi:MFS transporter [Hypericibacter adhaerens]|uniref:MFS transporter n=1 Tax=Hypericibacter adhaerens TaxID=2602016 RepID=A0A5J6N6G2_9PROT|nr:MFS transporter [Hypericibacter adhaerens]QEX25137.1 MFS transporter [Hypericibacter adhaerens]
MNATEAVRRDSRSDTDWAGVVFGVAFASLVAYQQFKLPPVLPMLLERYGYDRMLAGSFMSVYAVAGLLFSVPAGRWLARHGALRGITIAALVMIAGNLLSLLLPAQGWLMLAGRALEGFSFAIGAILGPAIAGRCASARHRHFAMALASAWIPIGQIAAGLGAPLALRADHWQWLWYGGIAVTGLLWLWGAALDRRHAFGHGQTGRGMVEPPLSSHERRGLLIGAGIFLLWSGQYYAYMTWLPQYLVEARSLGPVAAVFGYLLPVVVLMGFNVITGEILRRGMGVTLLLLIGVASQAINWWLTPLARSDEAGIALLVFYGIGAGVTPTCLFALPGAVLGRVAGPHAFAIIMTGRNVGVLLGPILLALLQQGHGGWDAVSPILAIVTSIATLGALLLYLDGRRRTVLQGTRR